MATEEDKKKSETEEAEASTGEALSRSSQEPLPEMSPEEIAKAESAAKTAFADANELGELDMPKGEGGLLALAGDVPAEVGAAPIQLGTRRFVFAAYFAFAILVAFIVTKVVSTIWYRLSQWKPQLGDEKEEIVMGVSALIGALTAVYYWRNKKVHSMIEEIASELAKVTWPTKQEVTNNTTVVIVTTAVATAFFALMDRFWGFVTDWVYRT